MARRYHDVGHRVRGELMNGTCRSLHIQLPVADLSAAYLLELLLICELSAIPQSNSESFLAGPIASPTSLKGRHVKGRRPVLIDNAPAPEFVESTALPRRTKIL